MEKRYQVFISSTYADLREERRKVIQTLMEIDCIPAGMELFPAADEEQWEFIKRVIDDCDYYLLIIGGRYGSTDPSGVSYTEKEYDYAIERGIKVIALLHGNPGALTVEKSDMDAELRSRLTAFRDKISKGRLVKFWNTAEELPGLVAVNLSKTIKAHPAVGWVRTDQVPSAEILQEINALRKSNSEFEKQLAELRSLAPTAPLVSDLAPFNADFSVSGSYHYGSMEKQWTYKTTWQEIFSVIAPYLLEFPLDYFVRSTVGRRLFENAGGNGTSVALNEAVFQKIKVQLMALNLVKLQYSTTVSGSTGLFWSLTSFGYQQMLQIGSIKATETLGNLLNAQGHGV
jgi:uncharacterized protein DUF4062